MQRTRKAIKNEHYSNHQKHLTIEKKKRITTESEYKNNAMQCNGMEWGGIGRRDCFYKSEI
jgi:hypothetical protein